MSTKTKIKTDQELKQIAMDIHAGRIFTDSHIRDGDQHMASMIFIPISLMDRDAMKELAESKPAMIFEYLNKALSRSINGYPIFCSMRMLSCDENKKVCEYYDKIKAAVDKI